MVEIYTDGASRGNPGKSACSFIFVEDKKVTLIKAFYLGTATNNIAEYSAIIKALEEAKKSKLNEIKVTSDSKLIILQIRKEYKTKAKHLEELNKKVLAITKSFKKIEFENVERENKYVQLADKICNILLDNS
jgi:ribonuclease HI